MAETHETQTEDISGSAADRRMERLMGLLLRTGVLVAASMVAIGGLLYLVQHGRETTGFSVFKATPLYVGHPGTLMEQAGGSRAALLMDIGILLLIATPILRVVLGLVSFARERDTMYVVVSALVLAALLLGTFHGS